MEAFPQWIIVLIGFIILSRVVALLARRFGLPSISVQILLGILLGPSPFNLLGVPVVLGTWGSPSSGPLHSALKILAEIGLIQLMFLAGLKVDWRELKKILKLSFSVGTWGFILTAVTAAIITRVFVGPWSEALAMSAILSASSFGISIYYFSEMKALGSRVAAMVSGAALLSGLLAILLMIASQATSYAMVYGASKMAIAVSWFLGKLVMFFAIAYFLASRFLSLALKSGFGKRPYQMLIGYLLLVAAVYAWGAMHFGSFAAVGVASLGGALLGMSNREVKEKIAKGFESILASIPIGILLILIGMEVNLKAAERSLIFLIVLLAAVIGAKLVAVLIAGHRADTSLGDRLLLTTGILPQGEMGILIAAYLFSRGVLNPSSFNAAIFVVILLTMITPIVMKAAQIKFNTEVNVTLPFTEGEKRRPLQ
jgi:Kef-type K+ transport system membrane component KefB